MKKANKLPPKCTSLQRENIEENRKLKDRQAD
jgi:hypothetical protein